MLEEFKNIEELVKLRSSVRDYEKNANIDEKIAKLMLFIEEINQTKGPFGNQITISLVSSKEDSKEMKLGTYGMIKGANTYLVVTASEADNYLIDLGYQFEQVVLYATSLGLGTCWMAGTFSRKHFAEAINLSDEVQMPIVSPVGVKAEKKSFKSKYIVKSKTHVRKEFGELFFKRSLDRPMVFEPTLEYMQALEMLRLAPSAINKQPWRVIKVEDDFYFYNADNKGKSDIDLGIALAHFDLTMKSLGQTGIIKIKENNLMPNYAFTWTNIK